MTAAQITTAAELDALPVGSVVRDNVGDAGLVDGRGMIRYAETDLLTVEYVVKHYGPLTVLYRPDASPVDRAVIGIHLTEEQMDAVNRAVQGWHDAVDAVDATLDAVRGLEHDRAVAERAWDLCAQSIVYEDGTPVDIARLVNPYRAAQTAGDPR